MTNPTRQPALPTLELPEYHGRKPVGMKTALAGAATRIVHPHSIGDRVVLVIEAKVKKAGHEETDDGLTYSETLKVVDMFELGADEGSRLLVAVRKIYADAKVAGEPLPDLGDIGYADASGVVMTPEEVAAIRNDPVKAVLSPDMSPAVVVYASGARLMWPDDFPKDSPRPTLGGDPDTAVVDLLHHETGESLIVTAEIADEETSNVVAIDSLKVAATIEGASAEVVDELGALDPEPYSGELGDDVAEWEDPDPATAARLEAAREAELPTSADFALVDQQIKYLPAMVAKIDDIVAVKRLIQAERQGRGRGLKPRAGAITIFENRIAALERDAGEGTDEPETF